MSKVVKTVFGGTDDSAQKAQTSANKSSQAFIERNTAQAKQDALRLTGAAQEQLQQGFQGAAGVLAGALPQQLQALQGGNVAAQRALLAGAPQFQNAILGLPAGLSGVPTAQPGVSAPPAIQPQTIQADTGFVQEALGSLQAQAPQQAVQTLAPNVGQITTDADLFRAAASGEIPGLTPTDQDFFGRALAATGAGGLGGTQFLQGAANNSAAIAGTGFNAKNQARLSNLLTQFQGLQ